MHSSHTDKHPQTLPLYHRACRKVIFYHLLIPEVQLIQAPTQGCCQLPRCLQQFISSFCSHCSSPTETSAPMAAAPGGSLFPVLQFLLLHIYFTMALFDLNIPQLGLRIDLYLSPHRNDWTSLLVFQCPAFPLLPICFPFPTFFISSLYLIMITFHSFSTPRKSMDTSSISAFQLFSLP